MITGRGDDTAIAVVIKVTILVAAAATAIECLLAPGGGVTGQRQGIANRMSNEATIAASPSMPATITASATAIG